MGIKFEKITALTSEMEALFILTEKKFWEELFAEAKKRHTVQSDFCLVRDDIKTENVEEYLLDLSTRLCKNFNLSSWKNERICAHSKYSYLSFYLAQDRLSYEFLITLTSCAIKLELLPSRLCIITLPLEDYVFAGNIISEIFNLLLSPEEKRINRLLEEWKEIEGLAENLTFKTIEIARNSIKTIYESSQENVKYMIQKNLFTDLEINKRVRRIYHRDFLNNPRVLTELLAH